MSNTNSQAELRIQNLKSKHNLEDDKLSKAPINSNINKSSDNRHIHLNE